MEVEDKGNLKASPRQNYFPNEGNCVEAMPSSTAVLLTMENCSRSFMRASFVIGVSDKCSPSLIRSHKTYLYSPVSPTAYRSVELAESLGVLKC